MTKRRAYAVTISATVLASAVVFVVYRPRATHLLMTQRVGDDTVVVNQTRLTRLSATLLDQYGHSLRADTAVRYRWIGGDSMRVSPNGEIRCTDDREATLRASFGHLSRQFVVRCRPVISIEAPTWLDLVAGDSSRDLSFVAHGPDGRAVTELRGAIIVADKSMVAANGATIRPKRSGATWAVIQVGNVEARIPIVIYRPVDSFIELSRRDGLMAMRVSLARGDTIEVPLPKAAFWVTYFSKEPDIAPPTIEIEGDGSCTLGDGVRQRRIEDGEYAKYCLTGNGARMMIAHGTRGAARVTGVVAVRLM